MLVTDRLSLDTLPCAELKERTSSNFAGRAYAAYGGIYIAASLLWLWTIESQRPDRWDVAGTAVRLAGAAIILQGRRSI